MLTTLQHIDLYSYIFSEGFGIKNQLTIEQISLRIHPDHKAVLETSLLFLSPDTIVSLLSYSSPSFAQ